MTPESFTWSKSPRVRREAVAPRPRPFDYGFTARRPLVPLSAVMLYLNLERHGVIELIESGKLRWAFDIAREGAGTREVRVLRDSMFEYTGLIPGENAGFEPEEERLQQVTEQIVPAGTVLRPGDTPGRRPGWPASVPQKLKRRNCPGPDAAVRSLVTSQPVLLGTEIAHCFSCCAGHILNLVREKSLVQGRFRRMPKTSPVVLRSSVVEFLRARRIW